jgi:virulence factor Mce-like protein
VKRIVIALLVLACGAGALVAAGAGGDSGAKTFTVEFDNAFGLVQGGDMRVAGVTAGRIGELRVDPKTRHALVDVEITREGYGSLREDAFCESRPQSLIGEYFIDCRPGKSPRELREGARIPVEHTASTIPPDLLNDIMQRPYRERLRILLDELGTGVGGRAEDLNASIRRLVPALRETDKTLALLARQSDTLVSLTENADRVVTDLAANRKDVGRWVVEAHDTAEASAARRSELAAGFRKLPGFLRELRPTMASLGQVADRQGPALADLSRSSGELRRLFENLPPFARSTQVNLRALARASDVGRPALKTAKPTADQLNRLAANAPELAKNLAIVLEHLDDRRFAVEKDPRSPGGNGYTGLEALLQYFFDQPMAINIFDENGYILKVNAFEDKCSPYQNADSLKAAVKQDPNLIKDCNAYIGPNQPGVLQPDPTTGSAQPAQARRARPRGDTGDRARGDGKRRRTRERGGESTGSGDIGRAPSGGGTDSGGSAPDPVGGVGDILDGILDDPPKVPPVPAAPKAPEKPLTDRERDAMLDWLLGS